jgi:hypothetical protein
MSKGRTKKGKTKIISSYQEKKAAIWLVEAASKIKKQISQAISAYINGSEDPRRF